MFTAFCSGSISFILIGQILFFLPYSLLTNHSGKRSASTGNLLTVALVLVVSIAILIMLLIFFGWSTFAFRNSAKILDNALIKRFFSLSSARRSSNSSWKESDRSLRKSRILSASSSSLVSVDRERALGLYVFFLKAMRGQFCRCCWCK